MKRLSVEELDKAAEMLLSVMPSHALDAYTEMAKIQMQIPLWQYVAGILLHAYNDARLGAYDVEPSWTEEGFGTYAPVCVICGESFEAVTFGQQVCGDKCGAILATKTLKEQLNKIEKERKRNTKKRVPRSEEVIVEVKKEVESEIEVEPLVVPELESKVEVEEEMKREVKKAPDKEPEKVVSKAPQKVAFTPTDTPIQKADKRHGKSILKMLDEIKKRKS